MKIAVLGCGSIGQRHLKNLLTLGYRDIVAFDPNTTAYQQIESLGVETVDKLDLVWHYQPQVVLITAATAVHTQLAGEAAERGCDLFIEKPLSHSTEGIDTLLELVQQKNLITMVGCNMRFHPSLVKVKALLEAEAVGDIIAAKIETGSYLPLWRPGQDYTRSYSASPLSGGAVLDCIHEIDLALWLLGEAELLYGVSLPATSIGLTTDGLAEMILQHGSGAISNVHLNFIQTNYHRCCRIVGSGGTIYWDWNEKTVKVYGEDGSISQSFIEPNGWQINQMYVDELVHFFEAVANRVQTTNSIGQAIKTLNIALAVKRNLISNDFEL